MGLPGSGKTWLGSRITDHLNLPFWDADIVRKIYNDWDFSGQGRERQSLRMHKLAEIDPISISAFIAPLPDYVRMFSSDKLIWMDTIKKCKYENTNKLFQSPKKYDVRITKWINEDQLFNCLEDFNRGTKDIENFLNVLIKKLDKLS